MGIALGEVNHVQAAIHGYDLMQARMALLVAVRTVLRNGCRLLGISAPEKM